jgi:hypothetical protein
LQHSAGVASQAVEKFHREWTDVWQGLDHPTGAGNSRNLQLLATKAKLAAAEGEYKATLPANPEQLSKVLTSEAMARLRDQEAAVVGKRSARLSYGEDSPSLAH